MYDTQTFEPSITFDIEFLHPCRRTTFNDISISDISYQLRNGQNQDLEVAIPSDVASTLYSDGWETCGARTYAITDANGDTPTWVTAVTEGASANNFIIRVSIDDETYVDNSPHAMSVTVGFANYPVADDALHPTSSYDFSITIIAAVCDCTLITWNEPENIPRIITASVVTTPATQALDEAGPLQSSLTDTSGARACDHDADECDYAYTITSRMQNGDPLPDWMVYE